MTKADNTSYHSPGLLKSLQDEAAEAAMSRLCSGIQYFFDNQNDLRSGEFIARCHYANL